MNYLFDSLIFIGCIAIAGILFAMVSDFIGILLSKIIPFGNIFLRFIFPFPLRIFISLTVYIIVVHYLYTKIWILPIICYSIYNLSFVYFIYFTDYPNTEDFDRMMDKTTINISAYNDRLKIAKLRIILECFISAIFLYYILIFGDTYFIK